MNDMQKLGKVEAMGLSLAVISNNIIFNMTSVIFNSCGSGSWLNVLYVSILSILFMLVAIFLFKRFISYDILDVSEVVHGLKELWLFYLLCSSCHFLQYP